MKRRGKSFLGVLLAVAMLATFIGGGALTAQAAPTEMDIIVHAPTTPATTLEGQTIDLYKIFDLSWDGASAYTYSITSAFDVPAFYTALNAAGLGTTFTTGDDVLAYLQATGANAPDMDAFSAAVLSFVEATPAITPSYSKVGGTGATSVTFPACPLGYYLVTGSVPALDKSKTGDVVYSAAVLVTNTSDTSSFDVYLKLDMPSVNKFVYDTPNDHWGKITDVNVGDTVNFMLTSTVPNMLGYSSYTFIMHDTMSPGLTPSWGSAAPSPSDFTVKIGGVKIPTTDYKVTKDATQPSDGSYAFSIEFLDFVQYNTGDAIEVTYSATLNDKAIVSYPGNVKENPNQVSLEYSNNPNVTTDTNTTTEHEVDVYTFALNVFKYTGTLGATTGSTPEVALADAEFELRTNPTDASTAVKFTQASVNATYTVDTAAGTITTLTSGSLTSLGKINIQGLDEGTYYLVETKAPSGYNPLSAPIKLTITTDKSTSTLDTVRGLTTVSYTYLDGEGVSQRMGGTDNDTLDVQNNSGNKLPATGGIGTTIFTIVGTTVMLCVVVVFVARRRLRKNAD